ncbi:MAG: NAD-dependent epimerase/dehydratase family protein [Candidatus Marinimicrobia bacterium]|jgi:dihydroflavonol-4-reductase|nr:NAD-dependent epimerase/dehydratase family protein [Candidatus Neomarinimicrobiota bacterium]MBT6841034.1 NAD-dependent epimerase/dehydratase family protein [Candidatus Neomarinimicrobiota bacterium]
MKKAFVTGGAGHVGGNLVRQLLNNGWQVRCLIHKDTRALNGLNIERVHGSLTDSKSLANHMAGCNVVFHSAAYVAVENVDIPVMEKINVGGTEAMCQAALEAQVKRFIHFSSVHAFQQRPTSEPLNEDRPLVHDLKAAPYDRTKAAAQRKVLDACRRGLNASILHPTGIIGPNDFKPSRMGKVISDIVNRKMPVSINNGFNWVDVRDVCQTAINCVDSGKQGQHYIVPGEWATFRNIADIISDFLEFRTTFLTIPFWTAYTALPFAFLKSKLSGERPSFSLGSLHALAVQCKDIPGTLARKKLAHLSRPLEDTIKDTVNEIMANVP